jgi:hypothetical protein
MENTGTHFETETEKLASAINNLANAIDRLNEKDQEEETQFKEVDYDSYEKNEIWEDVKPGDTPGEIGEVKIELKVRDDAMVYTQKELDKAREEGWRNGERYHFLLERQEEVSLNEEEVEELNLLSRELSKLKDKE